MILAFRKLHRYLLLVSMGFFFVLFYPLLVYFSQKPKRYNGMIRLRRIWAYCSTLMVGIVFTFDFEEPIDWRKTYVICPNHASNLDTAMICMLMKHDNFCFMGKADLVDDLLTAIYFKTVDIPVNRDSKMSAFRAFRAAAERLERHINMVMFPEGGIADEYPPQLQPFKNGPFRLAIEQKVAVIPVSSANTWKVFWDDGARYGSRPGVCRIKVHKPIPTAHLEIADADALRDKVYAIIKLHVDNKH